MTRTTVADLIGSNYVASGESLYGIEIEVEGVNIPMRGVFNEHWLVTEDGSLRAPRVDGGRALEYVLARPSSVNDCGNAIDRLMKAFTASKAVVVDSVRAGVHIHIDVRSLDLVQLFTFVSAFHILESFITDKCGEGRSGNHFALRISDAYNIVGMLRDYLERCPENVKVLGTDSIRYAALNLAAIRKHGSVEFRALRTPTNFKDILFWVKFLDDLKTNSIKRFGNPVDVVRGISMDGHRDFVLSLIRPDVADKMVFSDPYYTQTINRNVRLVQDYVFAVEDWDKLRYVKPEAPTSSLKFRVGREGGIGRVQLDPFQPAEIVVGEFEEVDDDPEPEDF